MRNQILNNEFVNTVFISARFICFAFSFCLLSTQIIAQIPPNDECSEAINVELNSTDECNVSYVVNLTHATPDQDWSLDFCEDNSNDIWFQFESVNDLEAIKVEIIESQEPNYQIRAELFRGNNCATMDHVGCTVLNFNETNPDIFATYIDLSPGMGDVFKLRLADYHFMGLPDFELCFSIPEAPSNDECLNAIEIGLNNLCANIDLFSATPSNEQECSPYPDLWYKWTWPDSIDAFSINNNYTLTNNLNLYAGDCSELELMHCTKSSTYLQSLVFQNPDLKGKTIYLVPNKINNEVTFAPNLSSICIQESPASTTLNNFCQIAGTLEISNPGACIFTSTTSSGANFSGIMPDCVPSGNYQDIWHKFIIPETGLFNFFVNDQFTWWDVSRYFALYKGTCDKLELIECFENMDYSFSTRMEFPDNIGDTIYFQTIKNISASTSYEYCAMELDSSLFPMNDICDFAEPIDIEYHDCDSVYIADNIFASNSNFDENCPGYDGNDLWFSFVIPASGELIIEAKSILNSPFEDAGMALYSGTCDSYTLIACNEDSGEGKMPAIHLSDPDLQNQSVYLQVWIANNANPGEFGLCFREPPISEGNFCNEAIFLPQSLICDNQSGEVFNTTGNSFSGHMPNCESQIDKDIWFEFSYKKAQKLVLRFDLAQINSIVDGKAALYRNDCNNLELIACSDNDGWNNMPQFDLEFLIEESFDEDQNFLVQFWDKKNELNGQFSYCLYDKALVDISNPVEGSILLFPNPVSENLWISIPSSASQYMQWTIINVEGKKIKSGTISQIQENEKIEIETKYLLPGTYILRMQNAKQDWTEKFIKF